MRIVSPQNRPFHLDCFYWTFRILGPLTLFGGGLILSSFSLYFSFLPFKIFLSNIIFYLILIILIFPVLMFFYSLFLTCFGDIGETKKVLNNSKYRQYLPQDFLQSLPICDKCGLPKPERAHHCSTCNSCHLRMDHHCPAVGVCVALRNLQPFICMLTWASISMILYSFLCLLAIIFISKTRIMSSVLLFGLFILQFAINIFKNDAIERISRNQTTIEEMSRSPNIYHLGIEENLRQIFGNSKYRFYLPKKSNLTGFEWSKPEFQNRALITGSIFTTV